MFKHKILPSKLSVAIFIFFVALSLRMLLFIAVGPWHDHVSKEIILKFDDSVRYHEKAILLNKNMPAIYDRPIYHYFIGLFYFIFGYRPYIVIIFHLIMGSLTCVFLYKIGQIIFNEQIAIFAGLFLAFEYSNILYSNLLLTEAMFIFLFIVFIYFFVKFLMKKNMRELVYSAIFLGLSAHVRPIGLYFSIFLIFPLFLYFRSNLKKGILSFIILISVLLLAIIPWMIRNYVVIGEFMLSADQSIAQNAIFPNLMNIIKPPRTIKHWTASEKRMIIEETKQPGMSVANVIKKYSIRAIQFFQWQQQLEDGELLLENSLEKKEVYSQQTEQDQNPQRGYFGTEIQSQEIPIKKSIIIAILADTKRFIRGMYRYFSVLGSSTYPQILGLPYTSIDHKTWANGLWEMAKVAIQQKSKLEWFFTGLGLSLLLYLYSTMCFGIYTSIRKKEFAKIVLFVFVIAYFALASFGVIADLSGYNDVKLRVRVPIMPYIILLSCYGMTELRDRWKHFHFRN